MTSAGDAEKTTSDAELVARVLAGDRDAFAEVYDRYGPRLFDFAYSMTRHREEAADAVADSFVLFAERLAQLRDPDRLRPWLYAIVRSVCLLRLKARRRVAYDGEEHLIAMADDRLTPDAVAEQAALRQLVWDAAEGLADRDRALLDLHLRQGLEGAELAEAMGVSASNAYSMLHRVRSQVERSLGALLIARMGRDDCPALEELLVDWDGTFSVLIRKRVTRHVDTCEVCSQRRRIMVSPWTLLASVPLFVAPLSLRDRVLADTRLVAHTPPASTGGPGTKAVAAAVTAVTVVAGVTTFLLWPKGQAQEAVPTPPPVTVSTTAPAPVEPSLAAAELDLSASEIDLGRTATHGTVTVTNTGGLPLDFTATTAQSWLAVTPARSTLDGDESTTLTVRADRRALAEGTASGTVELTWAGGAEQITVRLTREVDPVIARPAIDTPGVCSGSGRTHVVSSRITDASEVSRATLSWSGASSGSTSLSKSSNTWSGTVGPFAVGGTVTVTITATDARGNTSTRTASFSVDPCPG
ncbi:MAG TPA: sigma-70 family RNA polymerase sigma factor [Aeromicrobium sp.]|nr:sigma-70 family RNA polymerase sigma factor [Aeromicrobium sp.]